MTPVCAFNDGPELSRYLFGETSGDEKRRVEAHLATCSACRSELLAFERTVALVRANESGGARLDAASRERVMQAARTAVARAPARRFTLRPFLLSSVAAVVVIGMSLLIADHFRHGSALPASEREPVDQLMAARSQSNTESAPATTDAGQEMLQSQPDLSRQLRELGYPDAEREKLEGLGYLGGKKANKEIAKLEVDKSSADGLLVTAPAAGEKPSAEAKPAEPPQDGFASNKTQAAQTREGAANEKRAETDAAAPPSQEPARVAPPESPPPASAAPARGAATGSKQSSLATGGGGRGRPDAGGAAEELKKKNRVAGNQPAPAKDQAAGEELRFRESAAPAMKAPVPPVPATTPPAVDEPRIEDSARLLAQGLTARRLDDDTRKDVEESLKRDAQAGRAGDDGGDHASEADADRKEAVGREIDRLFARLERQPGETPSMMLFRYWGDNAFVEASEKAQSTFGVDVDTASYTLARAYLGQGNLPPREAVRTEEFVNYFKSTIPPPEQGTFRIHAEIAPSPFVETGHLLLKIGLKAKEVARSERRACALTFVVDVSGSMREGNRLDLVKDSLKLLVGVLDEGDRIGVTAFSSHATKVLEPVPAAQKERILAAIDSLHAEGSTNVDAGLTMGYAMAAGASIPKGNNRVILCSDGVANTGVTDQAQMLANVARYRAEGILLNCVGVGMGNHNDALLEQLADRGDGQCVYVDRLEEARRTFLDNLTGTLQTVARDVKIQVEFDPSRVLRYRQLGYENRALQNQDFRNDQVDAGEVGAGHEVVALYELKLRPEASGTLADIRVRSKDVDVPAEVAEIHRTVDASEVKASFEVSNPRFQLSAVAAEFAELLRESYWAHSHSLATLFPLAERVARSLPDDHDVTELCALIRRAAELEAARPDELAAAIDQAKRNIYLRNQLASSAVPVSDSELQKLSEQGEALRRKIEQLLEKR